MSENRHFILLIPGADGKGVLACVPGLDQLSYEGKDEDDALAGIKQLIERDAEETRNASPPYSMEDYLRDEILSRLRTEERRIVEEFDAGNPISDARALTMCRALLRIMGRRS